MDLGLHAGYWKGLKDYYEIDYDGIVPSENAEKYAKEMIAGGASVLDMDRPFDPDDIETWIEDTEEAVNEDEDPYIEYDNETIMDFPEIFSYHIYKDEIAAYFLFKDLERFRTEIKNGNQEFIDEALRLDWMEMIEEIPNVKDIFLF